MKQDHPLTATEILKERKEAQSDPRELFPGIYQWIEDLCKAVLKEIKK